MYRLSGMVKEKGLDGLYGWEDGLMNGETPFNRYSSIRVKFLLLIAAHDDGISPSQIAHRYQECPGILLGQRLGMGPRTKVVPNG